MACCLRNVVVHGEGLRWTAKKFPAYMNSKASPYVHKTLIRAHLKLVHS